MTSYYFVSKCSIIITAHKLLYFPIKYHSVVLVSYLKCISYVYYIFSINYPRVKKITDTQKQN